MKVVRFLRPNLQYNEGERAGFTDTHADRLVRNGVAEYYNKAIENPAKDKMVKSNGKITMDDVVHKGGGYYEFPDGETVQGKKAVEARIEELNKE